ncbi:4Fe-4S dicluster domain-containing protein [Desulfosporosinus lacus]|uniref:Anaerobic dimethyl sulfoxide reductase subunit B (DMSO reductase iron-sulfur subunit) n=1 Tax=Desulfosporosinus lacus DSM 15449 TaxID=1121420 RepID=A0A1M5Y914_9FIRM|nr:4Fe-4S dicluster domain-containing protein [Desulfosporosinus lacus]SHI08429.1 anaerobic dimethyl sulfoxide reductase subunit B (DMSO reductase iron-sulfur subunit) [Desulfosporosinus lacus DSM 15449]
MSHNKRIELSRRSVIKGGLLLGTVAAIGLMPIKLLRAEETVKENAEPKTKKQIGFSYDEAKCIKCENCVRICQETYKWEADSPWRKLLRNEKGDALSMSCNHCADPACAKVCPVNAYTKRESDGVVIQDSSKCVGCGYCLYACPYHAPHIQKKTGAVSKCHFCYKLQDSGSGPMCVGVCPTQALTMGNMKELSQQGNLNYKGLPNPKITNPSMIAIPK